MNGLNPLQMLLQSQQQGQFNAARAGMPGTGYGQNMSMAPQPSMSPVSPVPPVTPPQPGGKDTDAVLAILASLDPSIFDAPDAPQAQVINPGGNVITPAPMGKQQSMTQGILGMMQMLQGGKGGAT